MRGSPRRCLPLCSSGNSGAACSRDRKPEEVCRWGERPGLWVQRGREGAWKGAELAWVPMTKGNPFPAITETYGPHPSMVGVKRGHVTVG